MPVHSVMCYDKHYQMRHDGIMTNHGCNHSCNTWNADIWSPMKEEQVAQKMPGSWYYEEDTTSCSPVSDPEDMAQFLNHRTSIGVQNVTQSVEVPTSEHVAEIVGRQGCKIKALRAKTNTYIKTPIRGEDPIFVVTGRPEDVTEAKREIECAAEHFTQIRASRRHSQGAHAPGQVTIYVRVPLRVVGLVVGPKGATIKRIQQDTHTYIITPSREREPVFEVTGLPQNVESARKEIENHILQRTGNLPETDQESQTQFAGASLLQQAQQSALYRKAFANSNLFNQLGNEMPFGLDSTLGLDALLRSFPSMRNSLTADTLQNFNIGRLGNLGVQLPTNSNRSSLGGSSTKQEIPAYDYWGNNNSINDIMENEILSRNYDALSTWSSSIGCEMKEKREESPTSGLMSLRGGSSGFGFLNTIWSDNLNLSPGSLASATASPASSSCDHNDHTLVPISG